MKAVAHCTTTQFPGVACHDHGKQPSGYWVCRHVLEGAAVWLRLSASVSGSGVILCSECLEAERKSIAEFDANSRANIRLVCPKCAHAANLIQSPEVGIFCEPVKS